MLILFGFMQGSNYSIELVEGIIYKRPSNKIANIESIEYSIYYFKSKFSDLIPETKIIRKEDTHIIQQDYIDGKTLKDLEIYSYDELNKLLFFINKCIEILLDEGKYFDIVGYQGNQDFLKYKGVKKRIKHYNTINNFFNSTNIVINNNTPFFVDNVANYGIYQNNTFFNKVYRYILLLGYKNQILKKIKQL